MAFLQKVSFYNLICKNPWLFPAYRREKKAIADVSLIIYKKIVYIYYFLSSLNIIFVILFKLTWINKISNNKLTKLILGVCLF